ncbi:MAG: DNA replication/repair protein RecF [Kangiellaceae bacterium]|nr:DNA replication/repair protein RecF [Kangiellaceae bacterium]
MYLESIKTGNFRNLEQAEVILSKELTIISGDNAAGKSSILEAIVFLLSGRSFRTTKQPTLINHDKDALSVFGKFSTGSRVGLGFNRVENKKTIKIDGESIQSLSRIASIYPVQILCPESYHLVDSGPSERRKYLDWLLFHVEHNYHKEWSSFNKLLKQRNSCLKDQQFKRDNASLDVWDEQFIRYAEAVTNKRTKILVSLAPLIINTLNSLSFDSVDDLSFSYYSGYTGELKERLKESRNRDILVGSTQFGPHKADLKIKVKGRMVKDVLSRGQKKILINGLFISQTQQLKIETARDSLFMIDDFSSELDESNQSSLLSALRAQQNVQIILSCLHPTMLKPLVKGYNNVSMFHVEHGKITQNIPDI